MMLVLVEFDHALDDNQTNGQSWPRSADKLDILQDTIIDFYLILNGLENSPELNRTISAELYERSECNSNERVRFISNCHEGHSICI